jgi:hypothetical protein
MQLYSPLPRQSWLLVICATDCLVGPSLAGRCPVCASKAGAHQQPAYP